MIATLIPFFLACNISVDNDSWIHGPEYVFQVEANITAIPKNFNSSQVHSMFNPKLFCRPKKCHTLSCYFRETSMRDWDSNSSTTKTIEMSDEPFEVKFTKRGVEYLIVPADTAPHKISIIRSIVKQLDVGIDLNDKSYGTYDVERSNVEECNFLSRISQQVSLPFNRTNKSYDFVIQFQPELETSLTENITVIKERSVKNCKYKEPFFFGSIRRLENASKYIEEKLKNSQSFIIVTNDNLQAFTKTEGTLGAPIRFKQMNILEFISVSLMDIQPANTELSEISNPVKTKIIPNSELEKIDST